MGLTRLASCLLSVAFLTVGLNPTARADWNSERPIYGTYLGSCTTHYKNSQPGVCNEQLVVANNNSVAIPGDGGCLSPTAFFGTLFNYDAQLRSGGWQAQPGGQSMDVDFYYDNGRWTAQGTGQGLSDGNYYYECSFSQQ